MQRTPYIWKYPIAQTNCTVIYHPKHTQPITSIHGTSPTSGKEPKEFDPDVGSSMGDRGGRTMQRRSLGLAQPKRTFYGSKGGRREKNTLQLCCSECCAAVVETDLKWLVN